MSEVGFDELMRAYVSYRRITNSAKNKNTMIRFFKFLNSDSNLFPNVYASKQIDAEVAEKIKWLNGPNAQTLYKVWRVKHGAK